MEWENTSQWQGLIMEISKITNSKDMVYTDGTMDHFMMDSTKMEFVQAKGDM